MAYKPTDNIIVSCWGKDVGALVFDPSSGAYAFEYFQSFQKGGLELAPLTLPINTQQAVSFPHLPFATFYGLPAFIADSLPDAFGNALVDSWMAAQGVKSQDITPLDRLAYMGKRGMGALEFRPALRAERAKPTALEMGELVETARRAITVDLNADVDQSLEAFCAENNGSFEQSELAQLIAVGTSAGGARAKAVVGYNKKSNTFVSGQFDLPPGFEHWLIKFDVNTPQQSGDSRQYGRIEYAYYLMAKACEIDIQTSRLFEAAGRAHFMTKRFDRVIDTQANTQKLHQQTLCAMAGLDYKQRNAHDYNQLFLTTEELNIGYAAIDQIFTRMVFNVCMANNDDHTKNHSFLMDRDGAWQLSPAYDLTHAYRKNSLWLSKHLMSVNKKFENIAPEDLMQVARRFGVSEPKQRIKTVQEVASSWLSFAEEAGVPPNDAKRIQKDIEHVSTMLR